MKGLGIALILYPIITVVYGLVATASLTLAANIPLEAFVITVAYLYAFKDSLIDAYNNPKEDFSYGPLMAMGVGLLASIIMLWGLGMCDSSVSSSSDNKEELVETASLSDANADAANYQLTLMGKIWDEDAILVLNIVGDSITGTCTNVTTAEETEVSGVCADSEGTITIEMEGANSSWTLTPDESDNDLYHCVQYVSMAGGGEIDGGDFKVLERKNGNESE